MTCTNDPTVTNYCCRISHADDSVSFTYVPVTANE